MARITVEDCLTKETNRFALVLLAAKRTKQILRGAKALTPSDNKSVVTALREIADGQVRFMTESEAAEAREKGLLDDGSALEDRPAHAGYPGGAPVSGRNAEGHSANNGGSSPAFGLASKESDIFAAAFKDVDSKDTLGRDSDDGHKAIHVDDDADEDEDLSDDLIDDDSDDDDSDEDSEEAAAEAGKVSPPDDD